MRTAGLVPCRWSNHTQLAARRMSCLPDSSTTVNITVLPDSVHAPFTKSVFVESNDPATPYLRLNVSGNAVPLITVRPKAKLSVGTLQPSAKWKQAFLLSASEKGGVLGEPNVRGTYRLTVELSAQSNKPDAHRLVLRPPGKSVPGHLKCGVKIPILEPTGAKAVEIVVYGRVNSQP